MSNPLTAVSEYIPEHQALLIQTDMSGYLIDYFLHRADVAPETLPEHDRKLQDLIACMAIHLMIRPPTENHAWTTHMVAEEPFSLFVTGSSDPLNEDRAATGFIVGHVLTDYIRHTDVNAFHAQYVSNVGTPMRSYVQCEDPDIAAMVECFYRQSEQYPLRISLSRDSDKALGLAALPGCRMEWFESVVLADLEQSTKNGRKLMRSCEFRFVCECSPEKLLPFFRALPEETLTELYGSDNELVIRCPRCGKRFSIVRADVSGH